MKFIAVKKHNYNTRGTGGGGGKVLTAAEAILLDILVSKDSDLIEGIPGAYETELDDVS